MDYRDKIISDIADRQCKHISRRTIRTLQAMTEGMQSGDDTGGDTPLRNIWDEVCVQVQGYESVFWPAYVQTMKAIIANEVERLDITNKTAIWLQTDRGMDWEQGEDNQEAAPFCEDDIVHYVLQGFVLSAAANWTNKRIDEYLRDSSSFG